MAREKSQTIVSSYDHAEDINVIGQYVWDSGSLAWIKAVPAGGGGGGGLTDAELRATPVPVSGPLTDAQLRAVAVPVSGTFFQGTQPVSVASLPLPTGAATEATLGTRLTETDFDTKTGSLTEAAPGTDTASSGLNGRLQRIAQRLTTLLSVLPAALVGGRLDVNIGAPATLPVSIAGTLQVDVTDEPTRDLGKLDVASLDQYTPVSGRLPVDGSGVTQPVSGPLTDAQLRTTPVPVSGTVTSNQGTAGSTDWRSDLRRGQTILFASIDVAGSGDNTIVGANPGNKCKVLSYSLVCDGTVAVRWKSGAGTNLSGAMSFVANTGIAPPSFAPAEGHLFETAVNTALVLNLSAAIGVRGHMSYILEA